MRGYSIVAASAVPGSFTGCVRQHRVVFADGTVFACARTAAQTAYEPRAYVLRLGGEPPSVVLVGSRVLAGELLRLKLRDYPEPLRMNADPLLDPHVLAAAALQPVGRVPSINAVTQQESASLAEQQGRLPIRRHEKRSNR